MLEKFNGIFYLIIYLVHFIGVGVYAFQTIFGTKSFMERFGIDPSGAIMIRMGRSIYACCIFNVNLCRFY